MEQKKRLFIYDLAVQIANECRTEGLSSYPNNWTVEELTPDGCITVEYNTYESEPRISVDHSDPSNKRPCPNIIAAVKREVPTVNDIKDEYFERGKEYYRAGYPEETMTNADFL